jgi:hypothetical protein
MIKRCTDETSQSIEKKTDVERMFFGPNWNTRGIRVHKEHERATNPKQNVKKENAGEQNDVTGMSTSKGSRLMLLDLIILRGKESAPNKMRQIGFSIRDFTIIRANL